MSCFGGRMQEYDRVSLDRFDGKNLQSTVYFLSHLHEDHTVGLKEDILYKRLKSNKDIFLYCSEVTRVLLVASKKYHHLEPYIKPLGINTPTSIEIPDPFYEEKEVITVTLLPAFHCPGSVMCLIEGKEGTVLYTGDFRWEHFHIEQMHHLRSGESVKKLKSLYIDTTFCSLEYLHIPSRQQCIDAVYQLVREWTATSPEHVVNIYLRAQYGHEPLLNAVASRLGKKVHVNPHKAAIYDRIQEFHGNFTADGASTQIHACDKDCMIEVDGETMLCRDSHDRDKVLVILPTTMYFSQFLHLTLDKIVKKVGNNFFRACYSFHSSYTEVKDLLSYLKPEKVHPNVKPPADTSLAVTQYRLNTMLKECKETGTGEGDVIQIEDTKELGTLKTRSGHQVKKRKERESNDDADSLDFGTPTKVAKNNLSVSSLESNEEESSTPTAKVTRKGRGRGRGKSVTETQPRVGTRKSTRRSATTPTPDEATPKKAKKVERSPTPDLFPTPASDGSDQQSSFCGSQRSDSELSLFSSQKSGDHLASVEESASWTAGSFLAAISSSSEADTGDVRVCLEDDEQVDSQFVDDVTESEDTEPGNEVLDNKKPEMNVKEQGKENEKIKEQNIKDQQIVQNKDEEESARELTGGIEDVGDSLEDRVRLSGTTTDLSGTSTVISIKGSNKDGSDIETDEVDGIIEKSTPEIDLETTKSDDLKTEENVNSLDICESSEIKGIGDVSAVAVDDNVVKGIEAEKVDTENVIVLIDSDSNESNGNFWRDNSERFSDAEVKTTSTSSDEVIIGDAPIKNDAKTEMVLLDSDSNEVATGLDIVKDIQEDKIDRTEKDEQRSAKLIDDHSIGTSAADTEFMGNLNKGRTPIVVEPSINTSDVLKPEDNNATDATNNKDKDKIEEQWDLCVSSIGKEVNEDSGSTVSPVPCKLEEPLTQTNECEIAQKETIDRISKENENGNENSLVGEDDDVIEIVDLTGDDQSGHLESNDQIKQGRKNIKISLISQPLKMGSSSKAKKSNEKEVVEVKEKNSSSSESESELGVDISSSPEWLSADKSLQKISKYRKTMQKKLRKGKTGHSKEKKNGKSVEIEGIGDEVDSDDLSKFSRKELEEKDEIRRQALGFICETDSESDTDESSAPNSPQADVLYDDYVELTSDSDNEGGLGGGRHGSKTNSRKSNNTGAKGSDAASNGRSNSSSQGWISTRRNVSIPEPEPAESNKDFDKSANNTLVEGNAGIDNSFDQPVGAFNESKNESDDKNLHGQPLNHTLNTITSNPITSELTTSSDQETMCSGSTVAELPLSSTCKNQESDTASAKEVQDIGNDNEVKTDNILENKANGSNLTTVSEVSMETIDVNPSTAASEVKSRSMSPSQSSTIEVGKGKTDGESDVVATTEGNKTSENHDTSTTESTSLPEVDELHEQNSNNLQKAMTLETSAVSNGLSDKSDNSAHDIQERTKEDEPIAGAQHKEATQVEESMDKNILNKKDFSKDTGVKNGSEQKKNPDDKSSESKSVIEEVKTETRESTTSKELDGNQVHSFENNSLCETNNKPKDIALSCSNKQQKKLEDADIFTKENNKEKEKIVLLPSFEIATDQPPPPGTEEPIIPKKETKKIVPLISTVRRDKSKQNRSSLSVHSTTVPASTQSYSMYSTAQASTTQLPGQQVSVPWQYPTMPYATPQSYTVPPPAWNQYNSYTQYGPPPFSYSNVPPPVPSAVNIPNFPLDSTSIPTVSLPVATVSTTFPTFSTPVSTVSMSKSTGTFTRVTVATVTPTVFTTTSSTVSTSKPKKLEAWQIKASIFDKGPSGVAKNIISSTSKEHIRKRSVSSDFKESRSFSRKEERRSISNDLVDKLSSNQIQQSIVVPDMSSIKANISALTGLSVKSLQPSSAIVSSNSRQNPQTENLADLVDKLKKVEQMQTVYKAISVDSKPQEQNVGNVDIAGDGPNFDDRAHREERYDRGHSYDDYRDEEFHRSEHIEDKRDYDNFERVRYSGHEREERERRRPSYEYERNERPYPSDHIEHRRGYDEFERVRHTDHERSYYQSERDVHERRREQHFDDRREVDSYGRPVVDYERDPYYDSRGHDDIYDRQRELYERDRHFHERRRESSHPPRRERGHPAYRMEMDYEERYRKEEEEYRLWVEERRRQDYHRRERPPPRYADGFDDQRYHDPYYESHHSSRSYDRTYEDWLRERDRNFDQCHEDYPPRRPLPPEVPDSRFAYDRQRERRPSENMEDYYERDHTADPNNRQRGEVDNETGGTNSYRYVEENVKPEPAEPGYNPYTWDLLSRKKRRFAQPVTRKPVIARVISRSGQIISTQSASDAIPKAQAVPKLQEKSSNSESPVFLTGMNTFAACTSDST